MGYKKCSSCGRKREHEKFHKDRSRPDGFDAVCKQCKSERMKRYHALPDVKAVRKVQAREHYVDHRDEILAQNAIWHARPEAAAVRAKCSKRWAKTEAGQRYIAEYRRSHPELAAAHKALRNAVRRGEIVKPTTCTDCGKPHPRIEAHHHKGYDPIHWLDVHWVCPLCHNKYDRKKTRKPLHFTR